MIEGTSFSAGAPYMSVCVCVCDYCNSANQIGDDDDDDV